MLTSIYVWVFVQVAYTLMECEALPDDLETLSAMQVDLASVDGMLSSRVLNSIPGSGFFGYLK